MALDEIRSNRKLEHIKWAINQKENNITTGLENIILLHEALPKYNLSDINTTIQYLGKQLQAPIYINAMTGGHESLYKINEVLGECACETGIAIAVGSQKAAINDKALRKTYEVVRKKNPNGVVIGNMSAATSLEEAKIAVEMIEADALQLHLNIGQELMMKEGDIEFRHIRENIKYIKDNLNVPVIIKEVGCGMNKATLQELISMGIEYIDIGGAGGTNFIKIEADRQEELKDNSLINWGIPTAYCLLEAQKVNAKHLMASGGIQSALDSTKCLALGAEMVGMAGKILKLYDDGICLIEYIEELKEI